jgi:hypothetical protein
MGTGSDLGEASAETGKHLLHVATLLHRDDSQVVLLIDPNKEGLIVIVPGGGTQSSQSSSWNVVSKHIQKNILGVLKPKELPKAGSSWTQERGLPPKPPYFHQR